jgi:hypothetical protein
MPLPYAKPFLSGGQDNPSQFGGGHEMVSGHLHQLVQPAAQTLWTSVQAA